jgi:hypothetical protein
MRPHPERLPLLCLLCGCMCVTAVSVGAQTTAPDQPWSFTAGVVESFDNNLLLTNGGGRDFGSRLQAGIGRGWTFQRGDISVLGNASQQFYRQSSGLNTITYGLTAGTSYMLSRRATVSFSDSVTSGYAQDSTALVQSVQSSVLLPRVLLRGNVATGQWSYAASQRTQIGLGVSSQNVSFGSSAFTGGSNLLTRFTLTRGLDQSQKIGILADYAHTVTNRTTGNIYGLLGTWQGAIGKSLVVGLSGGVRPYTLPDHGYKFAPSGSVSVNLHLPKKVTFSLTYERAPVQAFGFGSTNESHVVGTSYDWSIGRRLRLTATGNYFQMGVSLATSRRRWGLLGGTSVACALGQGLALSVGYSQYLQTNAPSPKFVKDSRAMMSLTYGTRWR